MPAMILRPYQMNAISRLRAAYRGGHRNVLFQLATGGGKTLIFADIIRSAKGKGNKALILCHLKELINQASNKLNWAGVPHGIIAAGMDRDHGAPVIVASVQTLRRRLELLQQMQFKLIVIDEAHHCRADTYEAILRTLPEAYILGVTATPQRLDGKGLGVPAGLFSELVIGPSTLELIQQGFLCPVRCFAPTTVDLRGVRKVAGDYAARDVEALVSGQIVGSAVEHYRRLANHQPAIVFCVSIAHAERVRDEFAAAGYRAVEVDGTTPDGERERRIYGLGDGSVEVLTNCSLISEGVDVPQVAAIIQLRPTASLVLHRQQIGRGMRPAAGKRLIVLDHVGNLARHGVPEDEPQWTLDGTDPKQTGIAPAWTCRECGCLNPMHAESCGACGAPRPVRPREPLEEVAGELAEVNGQRRRRDSLAEYLATAARLGYQPGWVYHQVMDRVRFLMRANKLPAAEALLREFAAHRGYRRGWSAHQLRSLKMQ